MSRRNVRPLPPLLEELVRAGRWPHTQAEALRQKLVSRVSAERVAAFAPGESKLYLSPSPYVLVADRIVRGEELWTWPMSDPTGLDPSLAIAIGDFGLGSDAPIVLDYRTGAPPPCVLRLRWGATQAENRWVEVAPSFERFMEMLGI